MKITPSRVSIGPALPRPADAPAALTSGPIAGLATAPLHRGLLLGAFAAPPVPGDDWIAQSCEGVAAMLEAPGERGPWQYAVAGSTIGVVLGAIDIAAARRKGDPAAARAGWMKLGAGTLGVVAGSGVLHGHPSVQAAIEVVRTVLGSARLPEQPGPLTTYGGIGVSPVRR